MVERSAALVLSAPPKSEGCAAMISLQRLTQGLRPSMPSNSFEPFVMRERPECIVRRDVVRVLIVLSNRGTRLCQPARFGERSFALPCVCSHIRPQIPSAKGWGVILADLAALKITSVSTYERWGFRPGFSALSHYPRRHRRRCHRSASLPLSACPWRYSTAAAIPLEGSGKDSPAAP
jgi:hypothetical protein